MFRHKKAIFNNQITGNFDDSEKKQKEFSEQTSVRSITNKRHSRFGDNLNNTVMAQKNLDKKVMDNTENIGTFASKGNFKKTTIDIPEQNSNKKLLGMKNLDLKNLEDKELANDPMKTPINNKKLINDNNFAKEIILDEKKLKSQSRNETQRNTSFRINKKASISRERSHVNTRERFRKTGDKYKTVNKTCDNIQKKNQNDKDKCSKLLTKIFDTGMEVNTFRYEFVSTKNKVIAEFNDSINLLKEKTLSQEVMDIFIKDMAYELKNRETPIEDVMKNASKGAIILGIRKFNNKNFLQTENTHKNCKPNSVDSFEK